MSRFRQRAAGLREQEMLDTFLTLFATNGCFKTNIDKVASTSGISKASVYRQFESRDELVGAALRHGAIALEERCGRIADEAGRSDAEAQLLAVATELASLNTRQAPIAPAVLLRLSCSRWWASGIDAEDIVKDAFVPLVQRWQSMGLFDPGESAAWIADVLLRLAAVPMPVGMMAEPAEPFARRVTLVLRRAFEPRDRVPRSM